MELSSKKYNYPRALLDDAWLKLRIKSKEIDDELRGKNYSFHFLIGVDNVTRIVRYSIIDAAEMFK